MGGGGQAGGQGALAGGEGRAGGHRELPAARTGAGPELAPRRKNTKATVVPGRVRRCETPGGTPLRRLHTLKWGSFQCWAAQL